MDEGQKIYLPSQDSGVDTEEYLKRYIEREFPQREDGLGSIYSVPRFFQTKGKKQASLAEEEVFKRLSKVTVGEKIWMMFFHSSTYGGHSFRNHRIGKIIIREHDFVVFVRKNDKFFVVLIEVKSTSDQNSTKIKNNKRSAQHQLRDHLEVIDNIIKKQNGVQTYIVWPFLNAITKDPKQQPVNRWHEDGNLHVFENIMSSQEKFNEWFEKNIINGKNIDEDDFVTLLNRFVILSCAVFVDEINRGLLALLTQEQLDVLNNNICQKNRALVVHGAAGTGKTLLVLKKLQQLYQNGRLDENNRALYICYWPGIRYDMELKMESLGIRQFVDTARFYISISDFLKNNQNPYKHIFMDEAEAICLALDGKIMRHTLTTIYKSYHDGNCHCHNASFEELGDFHCHNSITNDWGELWFMVDINQASLFLPKHSPQILKTPSLLLTKVMRTTGYIFGVFKQFYSVPMPLLPKKILDNMKIPDISIGHHIYGPPIYWVDSKNSIDQVVAKIIVDLSTTKGFKPNDICVIPFLVNEKLIPERINKYIDEVFVENSFRPMAVRDVEHFLKREEINNFLMAWALRVKGLEFKVVIMAIDEDDFDCKDAEDRKKAYIVASRCTSMLIVVSTEAVKNDIDVGRRFEKYPFCIDL